MIFTVTVTRRTQSGSVLFFVSKIILNSIEFIFEFFVVLTLLSSPHVSKLMVRVGVNILRPPATRARECKEMHAQKERSLPPCARRKKLNSGDGRNPRNAHAHSFDSVHLHKTAVDN